VACRFPVVVIALLGVVFASFNDALRRLETWVETAAQVAPVVGWEQALRLTADPGAIQWCCSVEAVEEVPQEKAPVAAPESAGRMVVCLPPRVAEVFAPEPAVSWRAEDVAHWREIPRRPPVPPPRRRTHV